MFFSFIYPFFSKSTPRPPSQNVCDDDSEQKEFFRFFADEENGYFYEDFSLFYQDIHISIDLLFFIPYRGLLYGEILHWDVEMLQGATVKRPSKNKTKPSTRLERTEAAIRHKLEDILSFDSTVCERFLWLSGLREDEFDTLDSSFHELLPKERLIFSDSSKESIHQKFSALAPKLSEPYQKQKIMGSLQSHMLLIPTDEKSYGTFLSDEQKIFLETDYSDTVTSLFGEHNSGKSTLLIRKALLLLLKKPHEKILIITPTQIGNEILRNELISLTEYGALKVELASLNFCTPAYAQQNITELAGFQSASLVMCDDAYAMEKDFIDTLIEHREKRWLLLSFHNEYVPISDSTVILHNNYQKNIPFAKIPSSADKVLLTLLLELRSRLQSVNAEKIMVILQNDERINDYKEAIDEYFHLNARLLTSEFSLQYQNLDDLIITTPENACGLHMPHIYLVASDESEHYTYALSRASESATIISFSNPKRRN